LIPAARKEQIKNAVKTAGFVSASELATLLDSSLSTVRRDLIELERDGFLVRTRGGGQSVSPTVAAAMSRALEHSDEKMRIAKKAVDLIAEAGCIVLDAGTTTLTVARLLYPTKPLRVITDSIEIAYELKDRENTNVFVVGGILHPLSYNLCGGISEQMLENMRAQICVMGGVGLSVKSGLTKHDVDAFPVKRKMIDISHELVCVVDSSKFDVAGLYSVCPIERVDIVITDTGIHQDFRAALEGAGCEVIVV
jgi:DeoR/GlpR family transcriptional regulator of sugar metabolism